MIFLAFMYLLIGLAIGNFIAGFVGDDYNNSYILLTLLWPIFIVGILLVGLVFLFRSLGENFRESCLGDKEEQ